MSFLLGVVRHVRAYQMFCGINYQYLGKEQSFLLAVKHMEAANRSCNFSFVLLAIIPNYTQSAWNNKSPIFSESIE